MPIVHRCWVRLIIYISIHVLLLNSFYSSAVFVSICMFACAIPRWCYVHDSYIWLYRHRHVGGAVVSKNACFWWPPITAQRPVPSTLSPSSKPQPIMRLWPEPDVWCAELWLFQINYLMTWCCIHLMPRSLTCTPRLSRLSRTEREKLAGNGFSNTIIIPVSFSHLKFQYHIVFNLVSIHLNLFYILLKSNVATDRFKTQSLFPWNLDNFFLIVAGQIQIECKSTKI